MKIPEGMTEKEVLDSIERVANGLAHKYRFGYYNLDDMKQEARLECLAALEDYDPSKSKLTTFLWHHTKNRLYNLRRNKFERLDKPCLDCPLKAYDPHCIKSHSQCTEYSDKLECDLYKSWHKRNSTKKNIMSPIEIGNVCDEQERNMRKEDDIGDAIDLSDMVSLIDDNIPVHLRKSWVKMKCDIKMNKPERTKLLDAIREIISEYSYGT